jgi:hypothetical protein
MRFRGPFLMFALFISCAATTLLAQQTQDEHKVAFDIYKQLIETNTTESVGNMTRPRTISPLGCARGRMRGTAISSLAFTALAHANRFSLSRTWTWWRQTARIGLSIPSGSLKRTASSTGAGRAT